MACAWHVHGAEISWLSQMHVRGMRTACAWHVHGMCMACAQFPAEDEVLFAPLTALEVMATRIEGRVLVIEIRPNPAKASLQESSIQTKRRAQLLQAEKERKLVKANMSRGQWRGSMKNLKIAKSDYEAARTKEALAVEARQRGMQLRRQRTEMSSLKAEADARAAELEEQEREAREEVARAEEELERRRVEALKYDGIAKRSEARLEPEMSPGVYALTDPDRGPSRVIAHSIYMVGEP